MSAIDWSAVLTGTAAGMAVSVIYFAGLAIGMRWALRSANPVAVLTLSASLRIALLLGVAWSVVGLAGPWAALGFAAAFFAVRIFATTFARVTAP